MCLFLFVVADAHQPVVSGGSTDEEREALVAPSAPPAEDTMEQEDDGSIDSIIEGEFTPVVSKPIDWFKEPLFVILSPIYMFARLIINISQVGTSFFMHTRDLVPQLGSEIIKSQ